MSRRSSTMTIFIVIFGIIGVVFTAVSVGLLLGTFQSKQMCTQEVWATVVDMESRYSMPTSRRHGSYSYFPVFEYEYFGTQYQYQSSVGTRPPRYDVGESVKIKINPDDPTQVYEMESNDVLILIIIFGAFGIASLIAIVAMITLRLLRIL